MSIVLQAPDDGTPPSDRKGNPMTNRTLRERFWPVAPAAALLILSTTAGAALTGASAAPSTAAAPSTTSVVASALPTTGTTKTLVMRAYWTQPDSLTKEQAEKVVFSEANAWFREVSYGALGLSGDVTDWLKVEAPPEGKCYAEGGLTMSRAKAAAKAKGMDPANYQNFVVYFPQVTSGDCRGYPGWGTAGGLWLNGRMNLPVVAHELGHTYGLSHSNSLLCTGAVTSSCTFKEYGDDYDTMGRADETPHYSAPQKDKLGWLGTSRQIDLTQGGVTTLRPMAEQAVGIKAAKVTAGDRTYWIEYRQPVGYDARMRSAGYAGVQVRFTGTGSRGTGPVLIDPTPGTEPKVETATLGGGQRWTSPDGFTLSVGALNEKGAVIEVGRPPTVGSLSVSRVASGSAKISGTAKLSASATGTLTIRYGTTPAYGQTTNRTLTGSAAGDGTFQTAIAETLTGLAPGTTYHYSTTVTTAFGSASTPDQTFTAPGALPVPGPPVISELRSGAQGDTTLLFGTTRLFTASSGTQRLRYGPTSSYGTTLPARALEVRADINGAHTAYIGDSLSGLAPGVYHYSFTVTTPFGSVSSPDQTFTVAGPPAIRTLGTMPNSPGAVTVLGTASLFTAPTATQTIRYGTTTAYGRTTTRTVTSTRSSEGLHSAVIGDPLTGLQPGATYHYSVTLTTPFGTVTSPDKTFVA